MADETTEKVSSLGTQASVSILSGVRVEAGARVEIDAINVVGVQNIYQTGPNAASIAAALLKMLPGLQGSPLVSLQNQVEQKIDTFLKSQLNPQHVFGVLIFEMRRWQCESHEELTGAAIVEHFEKFKVQYLALNNVLINEFIATGTLISQVLGSRNLISRSTLNETLAEKINSSSNSLNITGEPKVGKTTTVYNYLLSPLNKLELGQYICFSPESFSATKLPLFEEEQLKLVVIDQAELFGSEELRAIVAASTKNNKRLILVGQVKLADIEIDTYQIPLLTNEEVFQEITRAGKNEGGIYCGGKFFLFSDLREKPQSEVWEALRYPGILTQALEAAVPLSEGTQLYSTDDEASTLDPYYVPLAINEVVPLYSVESLIKGLSHLGFSIYFNEGFNYERFLKYLPPMYYVISPMGDVYKDIESATKFLSFFSRNCKTHFFLFVDESVDSSIASREGWSLLWSELQQSGNWLCLTQNQFLLDALQFQYVNSEDQNIFVRNISNPRHFALPSSGKISLPPYIKGCANLLRREKVAQNTVIVTEAGSGKSELVKQTYKYWRITYFNSDCFEWVIHIPAVNLNPTDADLELTALAKKYNVDWNSPWKAEILQNSLKKRKVLFLVDGMDELKIDVRQKCALLLQRLSEYGVVIWTMRTEDVKNLHFNPALHLQLARFTPADVEAYLSKKFPAPAAALFREEAYGFLTKAENKSLFDMIGLPLQCYLLCEAWQPYYEGYLEDKNFPKPWSVASDFKTLHLYQQFVLARLSKFLQSHVGMRSTSKIQLPARVYLFCERYLRKLEEHAFAQLFNQSVSFPYEDWFDNDLQEMAFVSVSGETVCDSEVPQVAFRYAHKTYAEYFSAVHLARLLMQNVEYAREVIVSNRYNARYRLVWEFLAAMVSYGDPILPGSERLNQRFWTLLLDEPKDLIGVVENQLIVNCLRQSNLKLFGFDDEKIRSLEKGNLILTKQKESSEEEEVEVRVSSHSTPPSEPYIETFEVPKNWGTSYDSDYINKEYILQKLPKNYSPAAKQQCVEWLCGISTWSYKVKSAIAEALGEMGIASALVIERLERFARSKEKTGNVNHEAARALIKLGYAQKDLVVWGLIRAIGMRGSYHIPGPDDLFNGLDLTISQIKIILDEIDKNNCSVLFEKLVNVADGSALNSELHVFATTLLEKEGVSDIRKLACYLILVHRDASYADRALVLIDRSVKKDFDIDLLNVTRKFLKEKGESDLRKSILQKIYDSTFGWIAKKNSSYKNAIPGLIEFLSDFNAITAELIQKLLSVSDSDFWDTDAILPSIPFLGDYLENADISDAVIRYISNKLSGKGGINWRVEAHIIQPVLNELLNSTTKKESLKEVVRICIEVYSFVASDRSQRLLLQEAMKKADPMKYINKTEVVNCWCEYYQRVRNFDVSIQFIYDYCYYNEIALVVDGKEVMFYVLEEMIPIEEEDAEAFKRALLAVREARMAENVFVQLASLPEVLNLCHFSGFPAMVRQGISPRDVSSMPLVISVAARGVDRRIDFPPNKNYEYEDNDTDIILKSRVQELQTQARPESLVQIIEAMAPIDNISINGDITLHLYNHLRAILTDTSKRPRIILIPANIGGIHWVGLLIEINKSGQLVRAEYLDSLKSSGGQSPRVPQTFQDQLTQIYKGALFHIREDILKQPDRTSCGAYAIENLLFVAQNAVLDSSLTCDAIRQRHLDCLKRYRSNDYQTFNRCQHLNQPSVESVSQQMERYKRGNTRTLKGNQQMLDISKHLHGLTQNIQDMLWIALQPKATEAGEHLNDIRTAFGKTITECKGEDNQIILQKIIKIFFGVTWDRVEAPDLNKDCQLEYEHILAIAAHQTIQPVDYEAQQEDMRKKQIEADEKLAKELQHNKYASALNKHGFLTGSFKASGAMGTQLVPYSSQ